MSEILVVGSIAYDSIKTPDSRVANVLGGSANYFSVAASMFSRVNVVGVIGDDYRESDLELLKCRNVDLTGLQKVPGKTFHWEGEYREDMNEAITLDTQLNVFENFNPVIPESYKSSKFVFLANIDPDLQHRVLEQVDNPDFVGVDTMNLWIDIKKDSLTQLLGKVDVLLLNEGEARMLAGTWNTVAAAEKLSALGPKGVVIKRGEYGFFALMKEGGTKKFFVLPAYPVQKVVDPTGAGDTFAGGFFGYLAKIGNGWNLSHLKQACIQGCLLASFTVEDFGLGGLVSLDWPKVERRQAEYFDVISYTD